MRTDVVFVTDKDYNEQILQESDVSLLPVKGEKVEINATDFVVAERTFEYRSLSNIKTVCICWIRLDKAKK